MAVNSPHRAPHYPREYSASVVDKFLDNYARVHIFVARMIGKDPKEFREALIRAFMYRNARWNVTRDVLKYVHNQDLYAVLKALSLPDRTIYLTAVKTLCEDFLIDSEKLR